MATLTPFRYPGAKNKLLPIIMAHLDEMFIASIQQNFCDAFVGGGSVLLAVAQKYPKFQLFANDKDYWIYCFWKIVCGNDFNKLSELLTLVQEQPTLEAFYRLREEQTTDEIRCAYKAIFFNRTTFSGIFKAGPIGGKEQKSAYAINCRYNPGKLKQKILNCHNLLKDRVIVSNNDINDYSILTKTNCPIYLDPPYIKAGKDLYTEYMVEDEHKNLGKIIIDKKNWVLSYDDSDIIRRIYQNCNIYNTAGKYCINGAKTEWSQKNELIITPKFQQANAKIVVKFYQ